MQIPCNSTLIVRGYIGGSPVLQEHIYCAVPNLTHLALEFVSDWDITVQLVLDILCSCLQLETLFIPGPDLQALSSFLPHLQNLELDSEEIGSGLLTYPNIAFCNLCLSDVLPECLCS